jgi:hypothetical protein
MAISREELDNFLTQRVPRIAPPGLKSQLIKKSPTRVFLLIGAIFLLIGIGINWFMFPRRLLDSFKLDTGKKSFASGVVDGSEKTSMSVGKGNSRRRVYRIFFSWQTPDGKHVKGVCYHSSRRRYERGQKVEIQYLESSPYICRITGCTLSSFGYIGLLFTLFPFIGLGFIITWLVQRSRLNRLLAYGAPATGVISDVIATKVRVNKQQRYKIMVSYGREDGMQQDGFYYAYGTDVTAAEHKMDQGEAITILYDRAKPQKVLPIATSE